MAALERQTVVAVGSVCVARRFLFVAETKWVDEIFFRRCGGGDRFGVVSQERIGIPVGWWFRRRGAGRWLPGLFRRGGLVAFLAFFRRLFGADAGQWPAASDFPQTLD